MAQDKLKITYIVSVSYGGILHYSACLANAVAEMAEVTVIKPKDSYSHLFSSKVKVIELFNEVQFGRGKPSKWLTLRNIESLLSYWRIRQIKSMEQDILHFPELYPYSVFFAKWFGIHKCNKIVVTLHATFAAPLDLLKQKATVSYRIVTFATELLKRSLHKDIIIVHSEHNRKILTDSGISEKQISIVPHGVYSFFKENCREDVQEEPMTILFFGYIVPGKGLDVLLRASKAVAMRLSAFRLIVAGQGSVEEYGGLLSEIGTVELYNDYIPEGKVGELFQRAAVVVLPYVEHVGHSGVLLTAMGFNKPVIVSDIGDMSNIVTEGMDGLVVPPSDEGALEKAIVKLLTDDELRSNMKRNIARKANVLSWRNIAETHMMIYSCLAGLA